MRIRGVKVIEGDCRERVRQIEAHAYKKLLELVEPGRPHVQIGSIKKRCHG